MSPRLDTPSPRGTQSKALYTPSTNAIDSFILLLGKRRPRFDLPIAADTLSAWTKWTHHGTKFHQLDGHEMQQNMRSVALDVSLYHQHVDQYLVCSTPKQSNLSTSSSPSTYTFPGFGLCAREVTRRREWYPEGSGAGGQEATAWFSYCLPIHESPSALSARMTTKPLSCTTSPIPVSTSALTFVLQTRKSVRRTNSGSMCIASSSPFPIRSCIEGSEPRRCIHQRGAVQRQRGGQWLEDGGGDMGMSLKEGCDDDDGVGVEEGT
ncbi:hypothetical protein BKA70DRAFT_1476134 [Coprinopsis sp. MPI-PUGE-AT-0042]|nr:hypothetical protein BKA70DRAFT_1476134 [Coprinopsis sp. MPI-PUGE-AT-0042]